MKESIMDSKGVIFTAEKETFITRVLIKKVVDSGIDCYFVQNNVNDLTGALKESAPVVYFMDDGAKPKEEVVFFLREKLPELNSHLILIGDKNDINFFLDNMPGELIYSTFSRPVDNSEFMKSINGYLSKAHQGGFKKSILIIDDDAQYLSLVREWLKEKYKVYMANSGLQGIKLLGKNKVDLILLDHEMPVTSGPQVLEMLRSDEETRDIPVMFLTGKSDRKSVLEVVELKPEGYFLKSIKKEELLEKLNEFFMMHF